MPDFTAIRKTCEKNSRISERVVDDFLLNYAARHKGLEKKMNTHFGSYRNVLSRFDKSTVHMFKSQYIIHRVFREGGLINKLIKNPALQRFGGEEQQFLQQPLSVPWRFSVAEITAKPAEDFFTMQDAFTKKEYLLFSPGMNDMQKSNPPLTWFNLIGFNGSCWQTYGPIGAFQSFDSEDIMFFASERDHDIQEEEEVNADMEKDPLPYMLLNSGAAYPRTFHKEDEFIHHLSEYDLAKLDTSRLKKGFTSEYADMLYRFTPHNYGEHPHFAAVYYDEMAGIILFTAATRRGFQHVVNTFNSYGFNFPVVPYLRVRPQMVLTAEAILKREIDINEYEQFFKEQSDPETSDTLDRMNEFTGLVLTDINAGRKPDIEDAARKTGVPLETAQDLANVLIDKRNEFPGMSDPPVSPEDAGKRSGSGTKSKDEIQHHATGTERDSDNDQDARTERLRRIYESTRTIRNLEPWSYLSETDIFGIRIPGSDRTYFISVMGANGEYTSLAAYQGYTGLFSFYEMHTVIIPRPMEAILKTPHTMISFTDRGNLDKEDLQAIKQAGTGFRGKGRWPKLETVVPGYVPAFPEGENLDDLPVLLEQVIEVLRKGIKDPESLYMPGENEDQMLIRTPAGTQGTPKWQDRYEAPDPKQAAVHFNITYDTNTCEQVSKMKVGEFVLQADLVLLPNPVMDKGPRGYFPFLLLLVDKETGTIPGMPMLTPDPDIHSMYETVPQKLLEEITRLKYRPERIELRTELLYNLTETALKKAWCKPELVTEMPLVDEAVESLLDHLK